VDLGVHARRGAAPGAEAHVLSPSGERRPAEFAPVFGITPEFGAEYDGFEVEAFLLEKPLALRLLKAQAGNDLFHAHVRQRANALA
jgi:hypothetical protein